VVHRPTEQAHVVIGVPALDRDAEGRYALAVLDHVLGGGMSSRLFQEIRETRGLAYSVYSYRSSYQGAGTLAVYAGTAPARVRQVIGLINEELDRVRDHGITERELQLAQGHLRGSTALSLEDSGARMSRIGRSQLIHGRVPTLDEVDRLLGSVGVDDVARVAAEVLSGPRTLAVVGPFTDEDMAGLNS